MKLVCKKYIDLLLFSEEEILFFIKQCELKFMSGKKIMMNNSWCKIAI